MRTLIKKDPFSQIEKSESLFDDMFSSVWRPFNVPFRDEKLFIPMDIYEKDNQFKVKAAITGIKPQDTEINVEDGVLTIQGETHTEHEIEEAKVYRRECSSGHVTRSLRLPGHIDHEKGEAEFKNGFVTVSFPVIKANESKIIKVPKKGI